MARLCCSASWRNEDAYDVSVSLTGCEPNFMTFSEFNNSSGSFSYISPSSDVTLGKVLTEAHQGPADYCEPEGVSVSQSVSRRRLRKLVQVELWRQKKFINKLLQRWRNYENSTFDTIATHRGPQHYFGTLRQSTGIAK